MTSRRDRRRALVGNAADKGQVAAAARTEKTAEAQARADVLALTELPAGRRFLWRLMEQTHLFASNWSPSNEHVHFAAGERNIGLWAMHQINDANPTAFLTMMQDAGKE